MDTAPNRCAFWDVVEGWGWPPCSGNLHRHHVLNKSLMAGNKKARALVEGKYRRYLMRWVCDRHNVLRYADSKKGRAYLLAQIPERLRREILDDIMGQFKSAMENLK